MNFPPLLRRQLAILGVLACAFRTLPAETIEVPAFADAYVKDTGTKEGRALALAARGAGNDRKIYLAFDLGSALPPGKKIVSASLRLWVIEVFPGKNPIMPVGVYGIVDNKDKWEKDQIDWSSAPKNDPESGIAFESDGVAPLGTWNLDLEKHAPPKVFGPEEFTSPELAAFLNWAIGKGQRPVKDASLSDDDQIVTLMLASAEEKSALVIFASGDAATAKPRPTLVIETE